MTIYKPIKDQMWLILEYINLLEGKRNTDQRLDIQCLIDFLDLIKKQCDFYLNYRYYNDDRDNKIRKRIKK